MHQADTYLRRFFLYADKGSHTYIHTSIHPLIDRHPTQNITPLDRDQNTDNPASFREDFSKRSLAQVKMSYTVRHSSTLSTMRV